MENPQTKNEILREKKSSFPIWACVSVSRGLDRDPSGVGTATFESGVASGQVRPKGFPPGSGRGELGARVPCTQWPQQDCCFGLGPSHAHQPHIPATARRESRGGGGTSNTGKPCAHVPCSRQYGSPAITLRTFAPGRGVVLPLMSSYTEGHDAA